MRRGKSEWRLALWQTSRSRRTNVTQQSHTCDRLSQSALGRGRRERGHGVVEEICAASRETQGRQIHKRSSSRADIGARPSNAPKHRVWCEGTFYLSEAPHSLLHTTHSKNMPNTLATPQKSQCSPKRHNTHKRRARAKLSPLILKDRKRFHTVMQTKRRRYKQQRSGECELCTLLPDADSSCVPMRECDWEVLSATDPLPLPSATLYQRVFATAYRLSRWLLWRSA